MAKKGEECCEVVHSRSIYGSDKANMRNEKQGDFKHPCVYMITASKGMECWYSSKVVGHFGQAKVIISENGGNLGVHVDDKGEYGLTQFMFAIIIKNKEDGENIRKAITSEKFKKVWQAIQWMSNHKEWRVFKYFRSDFWKEFA